jgi:hypothetical protein
VGGVSVAHVTEVLTEGCEDSAENSAVFGFSVAVGVGCEVDSQGAEFASSGAEGEAEKREVSWLPTQRGV